MINRVGSGVFLSGWLISRLLIAPVSEGPCPFPCRLSSLCFSKQESIMWLLRLQYVQFFCTWKQEVRLWSNLPQTSQLCWNRFLRCVLGEKNLKHCGAEWFLPWRNWQINLFLGLSWFWWFSFLFICGPVVMNTPLGLRCTQVMAEWGPWHIWQLGWFCISFSCGLS